MERGKHRTTERQSIVALAFTIRVVANKINSSHTPSGDSKKFEATGVRHARYFQTRGTMTATFKEFAVSMRDSTRLTL
jgi:hypothetical protein